MDKLCLNSQEAANALGISLPTFYELSNRADFPRIKVGRPKDLPRIQLPYQVTLSYLT